MFSRFWVRLNKLSIAVSALALCPIIFLAQGLTTVKAITASSGSSAYSASISSNEAVEIDITPTDDQSIYYSTNSISYTNTCPYGLNISIATSSSNTDLMRSGLDSETKAIPTLLSGNTLTNNTWGYSIDGGGTYNPVPASSDPSVIVNTSASNITASTINVRYGVKIDNSLPSGLYTNDVVYTVTVKPQCLKYSIVWDYDGGTAAAGASYPEAMDYGDTLNLSILKPTKANYRFVGWSNGTDTFTGDEANANINSGNNTSLTMTAQWEPAIVGIHTISNMQQMTASICSVTTTPLASATAIDSDGTHLGDRSYVPRVSLKDTRDNKTYLVSKYADGKCWMTSNLRLVGPLTLTSQDSNITAASWNMPAQSWAGSYDYPYYYNPGGQIDAVWYNYNTATAGTISGSSNTTEATSSICPKGFKLPSLNDHATLFSTYSITEDGGYTKITAAPLSYKDTSYADRNRDATYYINSVNTGYWWTSTASGGGSSSVYRSHIYINRSLNKAYYDYPYWRSDGYSIRCVAVY